MTFILWPVQRFSDCKKGVKLEWGGEKVAVGFGLQEGSRRYSHWYASFCLLYWTVKNHWGGEEKPCSPCYWRVRCSVILQSAAQCYSAHCICVTWMWSDRWFPAAAWKGAAAALCKFDFPSKEKKKKKINKNTTIFASGHSLKKIPSSTSFACSGGSDWNTANMQFSGDV